MFNNAGGKIKSIAKILFIINAVLTGLASLVGIAAALFGGFGYGARRFSGIIIFGVIIAAALEILLAYISSLFLYAFGELVESNSSVAANTAGIPTMNTNVAYIASRMADSTPRRPEQQGPGQI